MRVVDLPEIPEYASEYTKKHFSSSISNFIVGIERELEDDLFRDKNTGKEIKIINNRGLDYQGKVGWVCFIMHIDGHKLMQVKCPETYKARATGKLTDIAWVYPDNVEFL